MVTCKKLKDVTVGELCDDRFQGCYYDDIPIDPEKGNDQEAGYVDKTQIIGDWWFTRRNYIQLTKEKYDGCPELPNVLEARQRRLDKLEKAILDFAESPKNEGVVKIGEYAFEPVGVDGVYICDQAVFQAPFNERGSNNWNESSGKILLEKWFEENAPMEIREQFDIDLPTAEEVFSQKMINWRGGDSVKGLVSKQFPIFKDSDERMKKFEGKPTWWWTRSASARFARIVWHVDTDGSIDSNGASVTLGFVPALRRKGN